MLSTTLPSRASSDGALNATDTGSSVSDMRKHKETAAPTPDVPGRPDDWRAQVKADLAAQLGSGGTLYGVRSDGAYIARTKDGDRVIGRLDRESA